MVLGVSLAALVAAALTAVPPAQPVVAAGTTLYVDGKHGDDGNSGLSWNAALRTINRAARKIPRFAPAAGWTVIVRGYADHIYRERPVPGGYARWGTDSSPVVFMADGWTPGGTSYTKPVVSGGIAAPLPGKSWQPDTAGVWSTAWNETPGGFDRAKPYSAAIFQGQTRWLWQHASLADLRGKARRGDGGYWYDAGAQRLYVATRGGVTPGSVSIEVPVRMGFYFAGSSGAHHISVRGFSIRHAMMGVTFHLGADFNTAFDNDVLGSSPMAFATSGRVLSGGGVDEAVGNAFLRNTASYSVLQGFKVDAGSRNTVICDNTIHHNAVQGVKVQGAADGGDPRQTRGTEVCGNLISDQDARRPGASRNDENPNGVTLSNGAKGSYVHHNTIRRNTVGIQVNQRGSGGDPIGGTQISRNVIAGNHHAGLNLRDGVASRSDGIGSLVGRYNVYSRNGTGIIVARGSTNKTFEHETVYDSVGNGVEVGCGGCATSEMDMTDSLISHNGRYGLVIGPGQDAQVSYVGLPSNRSGSVSGPAAKAHLNTQRAGYLSLDPASDDFVRIGATSFQYTAGLGGQPVGARY
jgi:hypothetical protein